MIIILSLKDDSSFVIDSNKKASQPAIASLITVNPANVCMCMKPTLDQLNIRNSDVAVIFLCCSCFRKKKNANDNDKTIGGAIEIVYLFTVRDKPKNINSCDKRPLNQCKRKQDYNSPKCRTCAHYEC